MYYEISVSLNRVHLFSTAPNDITNLDKAQKLYDIFSIKFPENHGYKITVTRWESTAQAVALY